MNISINTPPDTVDLGVNIVFQWMKIQIFTNDAKDQLKLGAEMLEMAPLCQVVN